MKLIFKKTMVLLLMGTAFITIEAKSQSKSPIHIGLKGGASLSNLSISDSRLETNYSIGYQGGIFARADVSNLYLQGELLYSQKQAKVGNGGLGMEKAKWNSIEIPVMIGYKLLKSEDVTLRVFGGGVYSYILKNDAPVLKHVSQTFEKFNKSNIGYQVGTGVDFGRLTFDMKYEGGLNKISNSFNARQNSFQASIGFMIL